MRKRTQRIIAGILSFVLFLSVAPITNGGNSEDGVLLNAFAAEQEYVIWEEDIVSAEDIEINGTVELRGDMTLLGNAKLIVNSGSFFVAPPATVEGDVELKHAAIFDCAGKLDGTLVIHSDTVAPTQEDENGTMVRPNNAAFWENSYVRRVELDGYAFWSVGGICDELITMPGSSGDTYITPEATVKYVLAQGDGNIFNMGTVMEAEVTGGFGFDNGGYVEKAKVTGGYQFYNGQDAYVKSMYVTDNGAVFNSQVHSEEGEKEGIIDTIVIESSVTHHVREERFHAEEDKEELSATNLTNYGTVNNLFAYGGSALNWGYMENVYLKDCQDFLGAYGWNTDLYKPLDAPYVVKHLLAEDSKIWLEKAGAGNHRTYATITVDNGSFGAMDSYVEKLQVTGTVENVHLDNTKIGCLYLDAEGENENPYFVSLDNYEPEMISAVLVDSEYIEEQKAAFNVLFGKYEYEEFEIPDYVTVAEGQVETGAALTGAKARYTSEKKTISTSKEKAIPLQEGLSYIENQKQGEAWFKLETKEPQMIDISLKSYQTVSVARLIDPAGHSVACSSGGETETVSCLAIEPGTYYLCVMGADYGADLEIAIGDAPQLQLTVQYEEQSEGLLVGKKTAAALQEFDISLYDETAKRELTDYVIVDNNIYFAERLQGHIIRIDMTNEAMSWKYPALSASFEFRTDEVMKLELTTKEFGIYRGNVTDSTDVRIYLYDADGNYMNSLPLEDGWFWSDYMKDGNYTAVFIRDAAGLYRFTRLGSFEEFGLKNHVDYIMDHFTIQAGSRTAYSNIDIPAAPKQSSEYLDAKTSVIRANMTNCTAGGMVQVTMKYKVADLYMDKADNLVAEFEFGKGTTLLGDVFSVNGEKSTDFVRSGQVVRLNLDKKAGSISFYASPEKGAETLALIASVCMKTGGKEVKEYVGNIAMDVVNLELKVPEVTGTMETYVYGVADPSIEVKIYEGDKIVGSTWTKANGKYTAKVRLQGGDSVWEHVLHAKVYEGTENEATTEEKTISFDRRAPILDAFEMEYYVHGQRSTIALTGEEFMTKKFYYDYWPGTVFTFDVGFENSEELERVYIVSYADGDVKELEAFYDESSDRWIATGQFSEDENYVPRHFYVRYVNKDYQSGEIKYDNLLLDADVEVEIDSVENVRVDYDDNSLVSIDLIKTEDAGNNLMCISNFTVMEEMWSTEELFARGFELIVDDVGTEIYGRTNVNNENMYITIDFYYRLNWVAETAAGNAENLQLMSTQIVEDYIGTLKDVYSAGLDIYGGILEGYVFVPEKIGNISLEKYQISDENMKLLKKDVDAAKEIIESLNVASEAIKQGAKAEWDKRGYQAQYDAFLQQMDHIRSLSYALKLKQGQYPSAECLMNDADVLIWMLPRLEESATNLLWAQMWARTFSGCLDVIIEPIKVKAFGLMGKAIQKVAVPTLKYGLRTAFGAYEEIMGKYQSRIYNWSVEKVAEHMTNQTMTSLTESVQIMDDLSNNSFSDWWMKDIFDQYDNMSDSIQSRLDTIEANLMEAISLCKPTPTPTPEVSPTPEPSQKPTPEPSQKPTPKPSQEPTKTPTSQPTGTPPSNPEDEPVYDDGEGKKIGTGEGEGIPDPSGYVYAGVRTNRIDGVKATAYFRDQDGNAILWDAAEYDQENPLYTTPQGTYCWMVPVGYWKVVYEKDGYETYETEWLPVPPPQTEVNINLMMKAAPSLQDVFLNEEYAYITFNMYVQTESVNGSAVTVSDASGNTFTGTLEAVNPEEEAGVMLADTYKLVFDGKSPKAGDNCVIAVNESVTGYNAKKSVAETRELICKAGVKALTAEIPAYLPIGEAVTIPVQVEAASYEGMELLVETEEAYIEVCSIGAIDDNGRAELVLKALRPGACDLRIRVSDSEKMIDVTAYCARAEDKALISYANKEAEAFPNGVVADTDTILDTDTSESAEVNLLWFVILAATLVLAVGTVGVIVIRKRKERKKE